MHQLDDFYRYIKNASYTTENLAHIKKWVQRNITDEKCEGTSQEQYEKYQNLVKHYGEVFLPKYESNELIGQINAIHYAAINGYSAFLASLPRDQNGRVNEVDSFGMTPLHLAAINGKNNTVKVLLELGALPNRTNNNQLFPLHCALLIPVRPDQNLIESKQKIFKLLKEKAPYAINAVDDSQNTVAHLICKGNFVSLVKDLIKEHLNLLMIKNNSGQYPIHAAVLSNAIESVQLLRKNQSIIRLVDDQLRTAIHYAAKYGTGLMVESCFTPETIDSFDIEQKTPLMIAAELGNLDAVKKLLKLGANPKLKNRQGHTVLYFAILSTNIPLINFMLTSPLFNLNETDAQGKTTLDQVMESTNGELDERVESVLLSHGAISSVNRLSNLSS